jgi:hypothetical protein
MDERVMSDPIKKFQLSITKCFRDLVLATAYLELGQHSVKTSPENASVTLMLSPEISTEPMYLNELIPHSSAVIHGVSELFQNKAIAAWSDLLNDLFEMFVSAHIDGRKQYPSLKKRVTRLDFSSAESVSNQIRLGLVADFSFGKYAERVQIVDRILNPEGKFQSELSVIKTHVAIRNSNQHHNGQVYADMLKELGSAAIDVFDHAGKPKSFSLGQPIELYVPEMDRLKAVLFLVTNLWRNRLA